MTKKRIDRKGKGHRWSSALAAVVMYVISLGNPFNVALRNTLPT